MKTSSRTDRQYDKLVDQLRTHADLAAALHLLQWDQETYMPSGVAESRARQIGTLSAALHERKTDATFLELVDELAGRIDELDPSQAVDVRETKWRIDRQRALDTQLVREQSELHAIARGRWVQAREDDDFKELQPYLERIVVMERQVARCIDATRDPYEVLLESYEPGMRLTTLAAYFDELAPALRPLVDRLPAESAAAQPTALQGHFPIEAQARFNRSVAVAIGFDFAKGRLDIAAHPFTMSIGDDVRLTTRYDENDLRYSLYSTIHEAGHGLYEQGLDRAAYGLPRGLACSLGVHESQSRFWENIVGRSSGFWQHFLPIVRQEFTAMSDASLSGVLRSANEWCRSFIRTESDELTYNLHIILRFELERALVAGDLATEDLPEAWREAMQRHLGITPASDRDGVLQDVHWASGAIGYFPTYTLGNIYAAELAAAAARDLGPLDGLLAQGDFFPLLDWLRSRIHRLGQTHRGHELIANAIGHEPRVTALVDHVAKKWESLDAI